MVISLYIITIVSGWMPYSWKFLRNKSFNDYLSPTIHKQMFMVHTPSPIVVISTPNFKLFISGINKIDKSLKFFSLKVSSYTVISTLAASDLL